ncbi:ABC transporter ATP-binding protein [Fodinicurvata sediminis]|uniref:ABC transporter ATP-binding protein n=1 Tax=Fodinicurvata sediminis TaxID=1121832 RepID=UPI0003B4DACE|nr:ABC transporter ATP-binding protein [Fodinicurvata sediminis]
MHLLIQDVSKFYGQFQALHDVSLEVGSEEFVCLLGPSGCGKTTLLRIVAGLEPFDSGRLQIGDRDLREIDAQHRGFGIVFQSYSLFPNMTVAENIGYGLKIRKWPRDKVDAKVRELMELVRFPELAERYPHELSGGQQQRVAIARALAVDPGLLLLDEPLSALDARVRAEMRTEIRDVQRRLGIPTIMVTHDQEEALTMADRIVCMQDGRIEQVGTPQDLYARPQTRFVADFVGISNLLDEQTAARLSPDLLAHKPEGTEAQLLALRPEQIGLRPDSTGEATVTQVTYLGNISRVTMEWHDQQLVSEVHSDGRFQPGDPVSFEIQPDAGAWVRA